ncbi:autotransporter-associated beta strand repeat-containing protein, partial [Micrococcus sp. SIMBA_131]
LVKQGSGNLTLSGANSYSGTTTVSAGFLLIAGDSNLGSGTLTIENSAGLTITGSGTIDNAIVLSGTFGIINTTTGVNATLSGI